MTAGGLLIAGVVVPVEGLEILNPVDGPAWCRLGSGDYRKRSSKWVRQVIVHGTRGGWPQHILPGAGPGGRDRVVADWWRKDPKHAGAHLVVDTDSTVACLADLVRDAVYHATVSNDWSIGVEMAQVGDNAVYEATLRTTVHLVRALCELLDIPFQIPGTYRGRPIARMLRGGPDCVGVFGHRDNTYDRGPGDPGDRLMAELAWAGAECFDYDRNEDRIAWRRRQAALKRLGENLTVDGIAGPATMAALRRRGFRSGLELDVAAL